MTQKDKTFEKIRQFEIGVNHSEINIYDDIDYLQQMLRNIEAFVAMEIFEDQQKKDSGGRRHVLREIKNIEEYLHPIFNKDKKKEIALIKEMITKVRKQLLGTLVLLRRYVFDDELILVDM